MPSGIRVLRDRYPHPAVGLVLPLPFLVLHHPPLLIELGLVDGAQEMPHAVGLHPQRDVEGGRGNVLEVIGAIVIGGTVEVGGPQRFEHLEVVVVVVLAAVEHQMLEEVGETGTPGFLVLRAHMVPDVHCDDGCLVILMDDQGEPIVEDELLIRDGDFGGGLGHGRGGTNRHHDSR